MALCATSDCVCSTPSLFRTAPHDILRHRFKGKCAALVRLDAAREGEILTPQAASGERGHRSRSFNSKPQPHTDIDLRSGLHEQYMYISP